MQYCQLQYIIKILLLNGLFVLSSHSMDSADALPSLLILSLPLNELSNHLSTLSDQPPVSAVCTTVPVSQLLRMTTSFLPNCNYYNRTFEPFPDNTRDFSNSRSANGMPPRPLNQNFCSLTDSYGKQNTKKRKINQSGDQNGGRARKRARTNLTPKEEAKEKKLDSNRQAAQKFRKRLKDAISAIVQETDVVGERDTGLNNALVVIRKWKNQYITLCKQQEKQNLWYNELLKKSCELKGLLYGIQFATPHYELKKYIGNFVGTPAKFNITEHAMDYMPYDNDNWLPLLLDIRLEGSSVQSVFNLVEYSSVSTDRPKLNQSDDKNCGREKRTRKRTRKKLTPKKLTFEEKKKLQQRKKNRISAEKSRARLNDAIKAITKETDIVGDGATGLKNALVVIRRRKCKYSTLLEQLKKQKSQSIELQKECFALQDFFDDISSTTSDEELAKSILETSII